MQEADGRWESFSSADHPIGTQRQPNPTLRVCPTANRLVSASRALAPLHPKSNPISFKLNAEWSNPVRGTSGNLLSEQEPVFQREMLVLAAASLKFGDELNNSFIQEKYSAYGRVFQWVKAQKTFSQTAWMNEHFHPLVGLSGSYSVRLMTFLDFNHPKLQTQLICSHCWRPVLHRGSTCSPNWNTKKFQDWSAALDCSR